MLTQLLLKFRGLRLPEISGAAGFGTNCFPSLGVVLAVGKPQRVWPLSRCSRLLTLQTGICLSYCAPYCRNKA